VVLTGLYVWLHAQRRTSIQSSVDIFSQAFVRASTHLEALLVRYCGGDKAVSVNTAIVASDACCIMGPCCVSPFVGMLIAASLWTQYPNLGALCKPGEGPDGKPRPEIDLGMCGAPVVMHR